MFILLGSRKPGMQLCTDVWAMASYLAWKKYIWKISNKEVCRKGKWMELTEWAEDVKYMCPR